MFDRGWVLVEMGWLYQLRRGDGVYSGDRQKPLTRVRGTAGKLVMLGKARLHVLA